MTYEFSDGRFFETAAALVADSSDLGIRAGQAMPQQIVLLHGDQSRTMYSFFAADREDGEIMGWRYQSTRDAKKLVVFND